MTHTPSPEELEAMHQDDPGDPPPKALARQLRREQEPAPEPFRALPCSDIAEKATLCSFLLSPREVGELCSEAGVTRDSFYASTNAAVFGALMGMWETGRPIDFVTVSTKLHDAKLLEESGGAGYLADLFTYIPTALNASQYIETLQEKLTLRRLIGVCHDHAKRAYDEQDEPNVVLEAAEKNVLAIRHKRRAQRGFTGRDVALVGGEALQHQWENIGRISGLSTGFSDLDRITDGLHPGELIVLAARPSLGKSALAMNIAEHVAIEVRSPVGVLSLEMGKVQLSKRLIASRARVNTARWRYGVKPTEHQIACINHAQEEYMRAPMFFEELSDPTIQEVRGIGRRMASDHSIRLMVIDSLSVMRSTSKQARENRAREVAECSNGAKEMAKELQIPIILIAHLDRGGDKAASPMRPRLADLRESGAIEQDADTVWMLWQPEEDRTELFGPKCRNGERNFSCPMSFVKEHCRFEYQTAGAEQQGLPV